MLPSHAEPHQLTVSLVSSLITIPGFENLTPAERFEIATRAERLRAGNSLDVERLEAALRRVLSLFVNYLVLLTDLTFPTHALTLPCSRDVTPPLDEEEQLEDSR